jgi:hypothetical protein
LRNRPQKWPGLSSAHLQGALLVQRTTGDSSQLKDMISALKSQLRG